MQELDLLKDLVKRSKKQTIAEAIKELSDEEANELLYDWGLWARDKQRLPEGDWDTWLINAGRGFGKTRTGAEVVREWKNDYPIIHLVAPTASDARDVMVEGESGILAISPPRDRPRYTPSLRRLTWDNGAIAIMFSADEPDRLRGPQCYKAWADELASWRYPEAWDQLQFGLRLGDNPQCIITTTPRPTEIIRSLIADERTIVTRGSTFENQANLADSFIRSLLRKYEGTRLGRQEIYAEVLDDFEGALWKSSDIEKHRVKQAPELKRIVIAIDPAVTSNKDSDETGIMAVGLGKDGDAYVLDDFSGTYSPNEWGMRAIGAYARLKADRVVAEVNQGGDMVETILRGIDRNVSYRGVHATKGKFTRAEPVAALYEQGRVHHVGVLPQLETQMVSWSPKEAKSPDRIDALVWGITDLMLTGSDAEFWVI